MSEPTYLMLREMYEAERALADDLAADLKRLLHSNGADPDHDVLVAEAFSTFARYRKARQRSRTDDEIRDAIRMEGDIG
jgi:hypothetical protein